MNPNPNQNPKSTEFQKLPKAKLDVKMDRVCYEFRFVY